MTDPKSQHGQEHTTEPVPNPGTAGVDKQPQQEKQPIPNQQQEDEKLIEYLVTEEGYTRPSAESELARDRDSVAARKKQWDQDQQAKTKGAKSSTPPPMPGHGGTKHTG